MCKCPKKLQIFQKNYKEVLNLQNKSWDYLKIIFSKKHVLVCFQLRSIIGDKTCSPLLPRLFFLHICTFCALLPLTFGRKFPYDIFLLTFFSNAPPPFPSLPQSTLPTIALVKKEILSNGGGGNWEGGLVVPGRWSKPKNFFWKLCQDFLESPNRNISYKINGDLSKLLSARSAATTLQSVSTFAMVSTFVFTTFVNLWF